MHYRRSSVPSAKSEESENHIALPHVEWIDNFYVFLPNFVNETSLREQRNHNKYLT